MLTDDEAEELKRKLARQRESDLERGTREARGRAAALRGAKSQKKAKAKDKQKAAVDAAVTAGKTPKSRLKKRSVFAVLGEAFETNRRKF